MKNEFLGSYLGPNFLVLRNENAYALKYILEAHYIILKFYCISEYVYALFCAWFSRF